MERVELSGDDGDEMQMLGEILVEAAVEARY